MTVAPALRLLDRVWTFRPADSGTLLPVDLDLPPGLDALEIRFRFVPPGGTDRNANTRAVTEAIRDYVRGTPFQEGFDVGRYIADRNMSGLLDRVNNLLNLTLHDPQGRLVGRWDTVDRDNPAPAFVSAGAASPGFAPAPLVPGRWRMVVEVWHVFHAPCAATLQVLGHRNIPSPLRGGGSAEPGWGARTGTSPPPLAGEGRRSRGGGARTGTERGGGPCCVRRWNVSVCPVCGTARCTRTRPIPTGSTPCTSWRRRPLRWGWTSLP